MEKIDEVNQYKRKIEALEDEVKKLREETKEVKRLREENKRLRNEIQSVEIINCVKDIQNDLRTRFVRLDELIP